MSRLFTNIFRRFRTFILKDEYERFRDVSFVELYLLTLPKVMIISTISFGKIRYDEKKNVIDGCMGCIGGFFIGYIGLPLLLITSPVIVFKSIDFVKEKI